MIAVRRELQLGLGALMLFEVVLCFGAIALFSRMAPAIERILQENVYSIEAAEEMLVVLALTADGPAGDDLRRRFQDALQAARDNTTEDEEVPVLNQIERNASRVLNGDRTALAATVEPLRRLVQINRDAMRRTHQEARRLGIAGAWAVVILAVAAFAVSFVVTQRVRSRILAPLDELQAVLRSTREGDSFRRCQLRDAPDELREAMRSINDLLDSRFPTAEEQDTGDAEGMNAGVHQEK